jgi:hypothetical protein
MEIAMNVNCLENAVTGNPQPGANNMRSPAAWKQHLRTAVIVAAAATSLTACSGSMPSQVQAWEESDSTLRLSIVASNPFERPFMRREALASLTRLRWQPSNETRLQIYSLFATSSDYQEAVKLAETFDAAKFAEVDDAVLAAASLLEQDGSWSTKWTTSAETYAAYHKVQSMNPKAVTMSLCLQLLARPNFEKRMIHLAVKLGIAGSDDELGRVLDVYGNKTMADRFLNAGNNAMSSHAHVWASDHGYRVVSYRTYGRGPSNNWGKY